MEPDTDAGVLSGVAALSLMAVRPSGGAVTWEAEEAERGWRREVAERGRRCQMSLGG